MRINQNFGGTSTPQRKLSLSISETLLKFILFLFGLLMKEIFNVFPSNILTKLRKCQYWIRKKYDKVDNEVFLIL